MSNKPLRSEKNKIPNNPDSTGKLHGEVIEKRSREAKKAEQSSSSAFFDRTWSQVSLGAVKF
jgi:hypothetical protein